MSDTPSDIAVSLWHTLNFFSRTQRVYRGLRAAGSRGVRGFCSYLRPLSKEKEGRSIANWPKWVASLSVVLAVVASLTIPVAMSSSVSADDGSTPQAQGSLYDYTVLDFPGAVETDPYGINDAGEIVGVYGVEDWYAFLYSGGSFTSFNPSDHARDIQPFGINDAGQIVGDYGYSAFLYSGGSFTTFEYPDSYTTYATKINDAGQIVGVVDLTFGSYSGFLYSGGSFTTFDFPGAIWTCPWGMNDAGQIVGYYYDAGWNSHGFLYSGGSFTTFDFPGADRTEAMGINDAGQIVGSCHDVNGWHGFMLDNGGFTTIDPPGSRYTHLYDINDAGQIVGYYYDVNGYPHGFVAKRALSGGIFKDEGGDTDASGNPIYQESIDIPIPGATVSTTINGEVKTATTDENGRYSIAGLADGEYALQVSYELCEQNAITAEPLSVTFPTSDSVNISVEYLPVNCAPSGSNYELWHEGPVFSGQQDVILVHGILPLDTLLNGEPNDYFGQLDNLLQREKHGQYNVWQFEYVQHFPIEWYADWLSNAVDTVKGLGGASNVDLIGFSMGGLISREYIEEGHRAEVGKLLTIGTPHYGSAWAEPQSLLLHYPDATEMLPGSRFLWDLNAQWQNMGNSFAAIGGTSWGNNDGVVNVSSASLVRSSEDGLAQTREFFYAVPYSHSSPFPGNRLAEIYDANDDGDPDSKAELFGCIAVFLASGSGALSQFDTNPKDFGGEPYISFCLMEMPKRDDILNETVRVVVSNTLHTYTVRSGLGLMGTLTVDSESICWFKASRDDSGEIKIFYAPDKYEVRYIDQGQSSVISKPIDNSGFGITGPVRVATSITPISAESGGYALAGYSGEYSKHSISIPAGSLDADTSIVISEPTDDHGLADAVDFGPDGTTFSQPATVTVEYKDSDVPAGFDESGMRLLVWENDEWEVVPGSAVNTEDNAVSGEVSHLSLYAAGYASAPGIFSCDSEGHPREQFAVGESVFAKGSGLEPNTSYLVWIQDDPVAEGDVLVPGEDLSGQQEQVITDDNGDFEPIEMWAIPADAAVSYHQYDIVLDKQDDGENTGKYNSASDGMDSVAAVGFCAPVPELSTLILLGGGLFLLGGWVVVRKRRAAA